MYKYTLGSDNSELVREVGAGFTGAIQTSVDINTEIYVQMYPNSTSSSATFNIRTIKVSDGNGGIAIIISATLVIWGLLGLVSLGIYCFYKKCCKYKNMSKVDSPCKPESGTQNQIFMNHKRVHYINSNQESNEITDRQIVNEDGASTQTENQIHQDQGETASSEVQSKTNWY